MTFSSLIVMACTLPVGCACIYLVLHPEYEDGFVGRIGLALISIAAFARFASNIGGGEYPITSIGTVVWVGLALFFIRHSYRFITRHQRVGHLYTANPHETAGKRQS